MKISDIQKLVCLEFGVTRDQLLSRSRKAKIVHARHIGMTLVRRETKASLTQIGNAFGGRDHTTVLHGIRKITHQYGLPPVAHG